MLTALVLGGFGAALLAPWVVRFAPRRAGWLLMLLPLGAFVAFARTLPAVTAGSPRTERLAWTPQLDLWLSFRLDGLALLFALLITGIGALVTLYAAHYLAGHPQLGRFYAYLFLFMSAMLGVVVADNVLAMFICWELTSLSSYALVGFEHERPQARRSALQALLVTVAGGQALMAGLLMLASMGGSFELSGLVGQGEALRAHPLYLPALLLVLAGAFTKSAQVPFHPWLPGAMEAPTPVSAYLHSATMVKAGVYLLMRLHPALGDTVPWALLLTGVGGATMLWGAARALAEVDLKRLLAYATLSVLGVLVMLLGVGTPAALHAALVYLLAHALYKGALFLLAGVVDHETGTRDVTRLSGLGRAMPFTATAAGLAALGMAGVLPVFGFIGKELVYESVLHAPRSAGLVTAASVLAFVLLVAVALMVGVRPFLGGPGTPPRAPHEAPPGLWGQPLLLAVLGLVCGLAPGLLAPLLSAAGEALRPGLGPLELSLWHGVNVALGLSVLSLAVGAAVFVGRERLLPVAGALSPPGLQAAWSFDRFLVGLNTVALWQTRLLQSGSHSRYLVLVLVSTFGLLGYTLAVRGDALLPPPTGQVEVADVGVALLTVLAAGAVVRARSRLASVTALGVVGFGVALLFLFFGAPDLALTQAIVEALTVVVFLLALLHLPRYTELSSGAVRLRDVALSLGVGGVMGLLALLAANPPPHPTISTYFLEQSVPLAHGHNVVNVILTDFRALDTLGEITVLAVAGLGVHALLKLRPAGRPRP
ncbi:putative monovalent cation/H+ antiporter subunit A [Archangium sp.]|uniref:putative monovalent cation/H+ antiporter subunit A n=1 Tax=Archangium sp. TaxID=1872627 RepID=UPI002D43F363|nr:putative monovalent cation/H+ antiporter subunit A [Archangium sp.]HYO53883.1 putative monovalent cation/H+ antiporter subunit A [Archangium sp.]